MRSLAMILIPILILGGLFSYLALPGVIEDQLAQRLQESFGTPTEPDVEVSSDFPPELLVGRIDGLRVGMEQVSVQGFALYNVRADLRGIDVAVQSLFEGNPEIETQSCSLAAEAPPLSIDHNQTCLGYLGLGLL